MGGRGAVGLERVDDVVEDDVRLEAHVVADGAHRVAALELLPHAHLSVVQSAHGLTNAPRHVRRRALEHVTKLQRRRSRRNGRGSCWLLGGRGAEVEVREGRQAGTGGGEDEGGDGLGHVIRMVCGVWRVGVGSGCGGR